MKKIFLILGLFITFHSVCAQEIKQEFKHPFFYQRLTDTYDDSVYVLTPSTKSFSLPIPDYYTEVKCTILNNQENFIKLLCNDCTDINCDKHEERINTFEILPYNEKTQNYYIKHKVFHKNDSTPIRENLLWLDNLMSIHPYQ